MWGPVVAVLEEWGLAREYGELIDTRKAVAEILDTITVGKRKLDNKVMAMAGGWLLLSMLRKATDAELITEAKVRRPSTGTTLC